MNHEQVGRLWNENADAWTTLTRRGYDTYRDALNTPAFFEILPDIRGLHGIDIGCGEGHNTRLLARRGARMNAIDIAEKFISHARQSESAESLGIDYRVASAVAIPYPAHTFDFATGFMSFMDIPEIEQVIAEAYRVLKPGGFLQFSIAHPCFDTPHRKNLRNEHGQTYALEVGDYFHNQNGEVEEWIFGTAPPEATAGLPNFRIPRFTRTLGQWLNLLVSVGFRLEQVAEPFASPETVLRYPNLQDTTVAAFFLHLRVRK